MTSYSVENGEVLIRFDYIPSQSVRAEMTADHQFKWDPERKVWHGAFTPENEALAQKITGNLPTELSLDEKLQMCIDAPGSEAKSKLTEALEEAVDENLDKYLDYIHHTAEEETSIQKKIEECMGKIEEEKSGYEVQKKALAAKRQIVEGVVAAYMTSIGADRTKGSQYNVSIKESYTYKLADEFAKELKAKIEAMLPDWLDVEFNIKKEAKGMNPMPEGMIVEKSKQSINVWADNEIDPGLSKKELDLMSFKQGKSIKEIADERGVRWQAVYENLKACMNEGTLDITAVVGQANIDRIVELYNQNHGLKPRGYVNALENAVTYDYVVLVLSHLGLSHFSKP